MKRNTLFGEPSKLQMKQQLIHNAHLATFEPSSFPSPFEGVPLGSSDQAKSRDDVQRILLASIKSTKEQLMNRIEICQKKAQACESSLTQQLKILAGTFEQLRAGLTSNIKAIELCNLRQAKIEKEVISKMSTDFRDQILEVQGRMAKQYDKKLKTSQVEMVRNVKKLTDVLKDKIESGVRENLRASLVSEFKEQLQKSRVDPKDAKPKKKQKVPRVQINLDIDPEIESFKKQLDQIKKRQSLRQETIGQMMLQLENKAKEREAQLKQELEQSMIREISPLSLELRSLRDVQNSLEESLILKLSRVDSQRSLVSNSLPYSANPMIAIPKLPVDKLSSPPDQNFSQEFRQFKAERDKLKKQGDDPRPPQVNGFPDMEVGNQFEDARETNFTKQDEFSFSSNLNESLADSEILGIQGDNYQIDNEGFLLDGNGDYLVDQNDSRIQLSQVQIGMLRQSSLLLEQ